MTYTNPAILSAVDTASQNGAAIDVSQIYKASFQAIFGDVTAAGTVKIQASNDPCSHGYQVGTFTPTNWSDISGATSTVVAGVAPLIAQIDLAYRWIRVVYTRSAGGSSTIIVNMFAHGA